MIFKFPLDFIGITTYFGSNHKGVDLGWHNYQGEPVYAAADGVVSSTRDYDTSGQSWGNFVKISHGNGWYTLYAHLKDGICVSNGQEVKQGDLLGYMGNTGYSYGTHLHYEVYQGGDSTSCRVNPLDYTYVFEGQQVSEKCKNDVKYYNGETHPQANDIYKVNEPTGLYLLDDNGSKIRAYLDSTQVKYLGMGYYKYGYQYYYVQVLEDGAVGYMASEFLTYVSSPNVEPEPTPEPEPMPEPVPEPTDDKDKQIEELKKQIQELEDYITSYKCEFNIEEDNYYKINMHKDETLCIKFAKDTTFEMHLDKGDIVRVK